MPHKSSTVNTLPATLKDEVYQFEKAWIARLLGFRKAPHIVYHYCDANGLVNIFKTRTLWATGHRYLNDRFEMTSMFRDLPTLTATIQHPAAKLLTELAAVEHKEGTQLLADAIGMEYFCTCFSGNRDLLSQWTSYADDGKGYAIGFRTQSMKYHENAFHRMIYGPSEQIALLETLFNGLGDIVKGHLRLFDPSPEDYGSNGQTARIWLSVRLGECLYELAPYTKHESFKQEEEWRIYASCHDMEFRVSRGSIVPYTTIDMRSKENDELMPIEEIIIGPKNNRLDAERVLLYMASKYGYGIGRISIYPSQAPYR